MTSYEPTLESLIPEISVQQALTVDCAEHGSEHVRETGTLDYRGISYASLYCNGPHVADENWLAKYMVPKLQST